MANTPDWTWRELWTRKLIYPGHTFPTAIAPVLVAVGLAARNHTFTLLPAVAAFLAGWLIQFGGVVTDNYENLVRQPDDSEHPEMVAALRSGVLTLGTLKTTVFLSYGLAVLLGIYLLMVGGWPVAAIGLLSIVASWLYSAGPIPVGRIGLADPLFFFFFGIVSVIGTYYVQAASTGAAGFPAAAFAVSLPVGALITNILIVDDIRDREFDAVKGKNTVAVRFGINWSRAEFVALLTFAYLAPFWLWLSVGLGPGVLLPVMTVPLAVMLALGISKRDSFADLVPFTPRAALLSLGYCALLGVGLWLF